MGLQSGAGSPMKGFLIILGLLGVSISKDPGVFKEYFDDSLRSVDVSQEVVLNSCLNDNGAASTKVKDAYGKCFGADYDFEELANNAGDNDGLPKSLAENEACFYKEMGWVQGNDVDSSVIKGDLTGLQGTALDTFTGKVDECTAWDGNFQGAGRVRRAAQELPSLVQGASVEGGWIRALVRKARAADNENKKKNKKGKKKRKNKKGKNNLGRKKGRSGKKQGKKKNGKKSVNGRKKNGKKARKGGRNNKKPKRQGKQGRKGGKKKKSAKKGNTKNKKGGKRKRKGRKGGKKSKKDKKKKNGRRGKKKGGKGKGKNEKERSNKGKGGKGKDKKSNNNNNKKDNENKKSGDKRSGNSLQESTQNKLWCFDLAMEQALEKCVEETLGKN